MTSRLVFLCVCVSVCVVVCAGDYRLPGTTLPQHYSIQLQLDPSPTVSSFLGQVAIQSRVQAATSSIVLHQHALKIDTVSVVLGDLELYSSHHVPEEGDDTHFLTIHLTREVLPGDMVTIHISYSGRVVTGGPRGLFRDSYRGPQGTRYLLATQLQPVFAREVFPCYDEPGLKATFHMQITCPQEYHALFNTPVSSVTKLASGSTRYSYQVTPLMSTYLVAVVVSGFAYLSNAESPLYRKEFRSYTRPQDRHLLAYSIDIGQRILNKLENYTDYPFALEKVDNVATSKFGGAMENWGLVIYGDYFLVEDRDDDDGEIYNKEEIAFIMTHEFAHFWFGNEATPSWWEYLWLSEGFATYFHSYMLDLVDPSFMMMDKFVPNMLSMMEPDSSSWTRPMNHPNIGSPQSVQGTFNFISYDKSACVIRMMSHILREEVMQQSLQTYIARKAKGNAIPEDLYEAMQDTINQRGGLRDGAYVAEVMDSWASQAGYPLLTVTREADSDYFNIKQRRFYSDQLESSEELWWVPLNWATATALDYNDTYPSLLMPPVTEVTIQIPNSRPYFILNKQATGYYRIMYDTENWETITHVLNNNPAEVHPNNRAQIVDDMAEFCKAGILPCSFTMDLLQYLSGETSLQPWIVAEKRFKQLFVLMEGSAEYSRLQKMVLSLNERRFQNLGSVDLKNEEPMLRKMRRNAASVACLAGAKECLLRGLSQVPSGRLARNQRTKVRGVELCAALRGLPATEAYRNWNILWRECMTSRRTAIRNEILQALPCIADTATLELLLQRVLQVEGEVTSLLQGLISSSPRGTTLLLEALVDQRLDIHSLRQRITSRGGLSDILRSLGDHITTQESYEMLGELSSQWRRERVLSVVESEAMLGAQEVARNNMRWIREQREQVEEWLRNNIH